MKRMKKGCTRYFLAFLAAFALTSAKAVEVVNIATEGATDLLLTGATAYRDGHLGTSLATGDFNGDGVDDLALGAPGMSSPRGTVRAGSVFIFFGDESVDLPEEVTTQDGLEDVMLYGAETKERAGDMLARGDFNGDGKDDLVIVGQYGIDGAGTVDVTKIYVVYGKSSLSGMLGLASAAEVLIQRGGGPSTSWPTFQVSAIGTGDIDDDGYSDLIFSDKVSNQFHVLLGQAQHWGANLELATDTDIVLGHSQDSNLFNTDYFPLYNQPEIAGVAAGDLNGDGIDDLAFGVPNETAHGITNAGRVYVLYGGTEFTSGTVLDVDQASDAVLTGGCLNDKAGGPLAIGEISGDMYADLVIGQPRSQRCLVNSTDLGKVQAVFGSALLSESIDLFDDADVTLNLSGDGSPESVGRIGFRTGQTVLTADLNGDTQRDLLIGSPGAFHSNGANGWVHVIYGGAALQGAYELDQDADLWYETPEPVGPRLVSGRMGESIAVFDLNDDGARDLAMGAPLGISENGGFVPVILGQGLPPEVVIAMQEVYIAYYGRPADPGGVNYWGNRLHEENGNLDALIAAYGTSQEYTDRYGSLSDAELINTLYGNMFGRDADPAGLQWYIDERLSLYRQEWTDDHGGDPTGATQYALSRIALDILNGAGGDDRLIIDNKVEVVLYFTKQVLRFSATYDAADIPSATAILQRVTADPSSVAAAMVEIDQVIRNF